MNKIIKNALILAAITLIAGIASRGGTSGNPGADPENSRRKEKTGILSERIPGGSFL